jgi:hypothetical protein
MGEGRMVPRGERSGGRGGAGGKGGEGRGRGGAEPETERGARREALARATRGPIPSRWRGHPPDELRAAHAAVVATTEATYAGTKVPGAKYLIDQTARDPPGKIASGHGDGVFGPANPSKPSGTFCGFRDTYPRELRREVAASPRGCYPSLGPYKLWQCDHPFDVLQPEGIARGMLEFLRFTLVLMCFRWTDKTRGIRFREVSSLGLLAALGAKLDDLSRGDS